MGKIIFLEIEGIFLELLDSIKTPHRSECYELELMIRQLEFQLVRIEANVIHELFSAF